MTTNKKEDSKMNITTEYGNFYGSFEEMDARAYAAINLCIPDSGLKWLDSMIEKKRRDEFAKVVMQAYIMKPKRMEKFTDHKEAENLSLSQEAYEFADYMISFSKKDKK